MPYYEDAEHTTAFMKQAQKDNKPFFINMWIHEPHTPHHVIPKYQWNFEDLEEKDNIYASVISHADDRIGKVLDALDDMGLTDNTLVVFSSDNGPARTAEATELRTYLDTASAFAFAGISEYISSSGKGSCKYWAPMHRRK